jgi:beta-glucanase (GH16 family)
MVVTEAAPAIGEPPVARRRRRRVAVALGAVAVLALAGLALKVATRRTTVVAGAPAAGPQALTCGGQRVAKSDGTPWTCTFDDEFDGTSLAGELWTAATTAQTGFRGGQECIVTGAVQVGAGLLHLTADRTPPRQCGRYTTSYTSGTIWTKGKFAQTYGRFEMRAKFPPGVGLQPAFWMLPQNPYSSGSYSYGEIDVAEEWGNYPQYVEPHLHYVRTPGSPSGGAACKVPTNASAFHTYTLTWTPTQMRIDYDGTPCWTTGWEPQPPTTAPAGAKPPVPFDQPFYVIVQLAVGGQKTPANVPTPSTPLPAHMEVDYVRVWS